ncbi:MAG: 30S ribosomal protein S16 [Lentisphaerae bacterium ADurb.BinA184]|nr:MAG: 30S ribosomal protein S16 [Lentisphaerae bacterium ADurb.BinA184]
MAVKIRLRRVGKLNAASFRVVVTDIRSPRDGRFIECIGHYNPHLKSESIEVARADYWMSKGAKPSLTVAAIIKRAKTGTQMAGRKPAPAAAKAEKPAKAEKAEKAEKPAPAGETKAD